MNKKRILLYLLMLCNFLNVSSAKEIIIDGENLSIDQLTEVARNKVKVKFSDQAEKRIKTTREYMEDLVQQDKAIYGLTTGFGFLENTRISKEQTEQLQVNLIRSHAAGVGNALPEEIVRAAILLRANTFAKGFSGIRLETAHKLLDLINKNIYPYVPEKGSVGASGDLSPLSHIMLVLIGEGEVFFNGKRTPTSSILKELDFQPTRLSFKEGLALNNGTQVLTATAALTLYDSQILIKNSIITAAVTLEAIKACSSPFNKNIHLARAHQGQINCAANMRLLLQESDLIDSSNKKIQDAYSIRCFPQIIGAAIDTYNYAKKVVEIELNSATDNPLIFEDSGATSGGNFHGEPIALAMDFMGIALCEIGNVSERRTARLVDPHLNEELPAFLIESSGLNSGLMIPQYTAAALVSENKILSHPASVDSIPTSANQEDHVSMGSIASRKAKEILNNVFYIISIELLNATQALDFRAEKPGKAVQIIKNLVREKIDFIDNDKIMYNDIENINKMLYSNLLVEAVEKAIGQLKI